MLELIVKGDERYDEERNEFIPAMEPHKLMLEHSLVSISKWESNYRKPFLSTDLNTEQCIYYIRCMTINPQPDKVYNYITADHIDAVTKYIKDEHTATWFSNLKEELPQKTGKMNGKIITSEIVYYWMIQMNIPIEFQKWHFNRLLTLIKVISIENDPKGKKTKMSAADRRALNAARKAKYHSRG